MQRHTIAAIGVAVLLVLAGCSTGPSSSASPTPEQPNSTIHVAGSGSADAEPNQAVLQVAVVATAPDAATARQRLAENTSRMRDALQGIGIDDEHIRTERYDIYRDRTPPREEGEEPPVRYRASHDFEITVDDPDRVGTVLDTAVQNGATEVNDVTFTLSSDRRRQLEQQARSAAMADARAKAEMLASTENLTVTGVDVIRTTSGDSPLPVDEYAAATATPAPTAGAASDIESGPVTVRTTVRVVYEASPSENATA
ncbi:SIMPL domain-containing protein [Haloplanus halobius]|uniref:SIMPL domain-containing protein n=1 Tax=Haloplanus halobius TaxID=2934938 RepID=UPI00200DABDF|nr:SIMPL domain-containing protein [Haloplanus sp. XH21]